ncbi:MAG: hypothetical protein AB1791_03735 [Chloroflexota bacterium]
MTSLNATQTAAIQANETSFLLGPAGTGKSTVLYHRLLRLLQEGEPAYTLLGLVAEPEQRPGFLDALHQSGLGPYAELKITTYNRLAQEMVSLFWPLVARPAGFSRPYQPPTFLSYDLAQLLMWRIVTPMVEEGAFARLRLRPQQIVSQLLDTLNRAALNGLTLDEAITRQINAWAGEPDHLRHLEDAATAARRFRQFCLENSLVDLSLNVQVFDTQLVRHPEFYAYFQERYRHLLVDNVEEQTPAGQNFVASLMNATQTTAIAYDMGGGYKRFLAADPLGANRFRALCRHVFDFSHSYTANPAALALAGRAANSLLRNSVVLGTQGIEETEGTAEADESKIQNPKSKIQNIGGRYRHEMVANLMPVLVRLVAEGTPPAQIAIVTPYLDEALRYNLTHALRQAGLPYRLLRRRSSPREEPRVRAWLTWLVLAHPDWGVQPAAYDVSEALSLSIGGLDVVRATLLAQHLYGPDPAGLADNRPQLRPAADLPDKMVQRVGVENVERVEELRQWLVEQGGRYPLDTFLQRLFADLLSQPRFQPEPDLAGAAVCDWLVQVAYRLRRAAPAMGLRTPAEVGRAFIQGIYQGLVTADPPDLGNPPDPKGIILATVYGYLLAGAPVQIQVWLDAAATGWWDIPRQPLSNAFVLAQSWPADRRWTTDEDFRTRNELLSRLVRGLAARCGREVIIASSDLDRRGLRQDGPLWRALRAYVDTDGRD